MRKLLVMAALLPSIAWANESGSEFFYQSGAGEIDGTFGLTMGTVEVKGPVIGTSKTTTNVLSAHFEYGLDEHNAFGARIGYQDGETDDGTSKNDVSGLQDLEVSYKGTQDAGGGKLKYGAGLEVSLGKSETEANGDENAQSGGMLLAPYVGWEQAAGEMLWGLKFQTEFELAARKYDNKSTPETGENEGDEETTISAFLEHKMNEGFVLGGALEYLMIAEGESTPDGGSTTTSESPTPFIGIKVYAPMALGAGTLIPSVRYVTTSDDSIDVGGSAVVVDSADITEIAVNYRMMF